MKYLLEDELEKDLLNGRPRNQELISPVIQAQTSIRESGLDTNSAMAVLDRFLAICEKWKNIYGEKPVPEIHKTLLENLIDTEYRIDDAPPYHCAGSTVTNYADLIFQNIISENTDEIIRQSFDNLIAESSSKVILQLTVLFHAANNEILESLRCYELLLRATNKIEKLQNQKYQTSNKKRIKTSLQTREEKTKQKREELYKLFKGLEERGINPREWPGIAETQKIYKSDTARKYRDEVYLKKPIE